MSQVRHNGACACLDLERNALFTLLGHEAPACSYASYPCCLHHYSLSQSPQQRACIVLLELHKVPTLFLCSVFSDLIYNKLYSVSEGHNMYKKGYVTRILLF